MMSETVEVDATGTIRGFPYHDGWLDAVVLGDRTARLELRSKDGAKRILKLVGVSALHVEGLRESNVVLNLRLLTVAAATADESVRDAMRDRLYVDASSIPAGSFIFMLEPSFGGEVIAICTSVEVSLAAVAVVVGGKSP